MSPERKKIIDDVKVEEFCWAGRLVVYVDNLRTNETFEQACNRLELELGEKLLAEGEMPGGFN